MNFIDTIEIKNFKSVRHQKIEGCKRINVFIGYPNVGKSNILEGIGLYSVAQQVNQERFSFNSICRINHFSDLYFDKNIKEKIEININDKYILSIQKEKSYPEFRIVIRLKGEPGYAFQTDIGEMYNFLNSSPPPVKEAIDNAVIYKIKSYHFNGSAELGKTKSFSLSIPEGDNLIDILQGSPILRKEYSNLLSLYNLKLNISDNNIISVAKELNDGTFVSFQNTLVSDTLRRLFFYKAAIMTNKNSVILFEEPEAHMFPPYIRKFTTDIIFDKTNQFFIATHSPYVLDALMEDAKDDLAIYLVYYDEGETKVKQMPQEEMDEVKKYGVDLFYNLESYLKHGQIDNA